jgi:hypothetical protein
LDRFLQIFGKQESPEMAYVGYIFICLNGVLNSGIYAYNQIVNRTSIKKDLTGLIYGNSSSKPIISNSNEVSQEQSEN